MNIKNRTFLASLATTVGVIMVAGLGLVALGAQQGPPQGRGPGGQGGPGMRGGGMFGGQGGPGMRGGPGGRGPMAGPMMLGLAQLDLTAEQQAKVKVIHEAQRDGMQGLGQQMQAAREAVEDAVIANNKEAIPALVNAVAALEVKAALARADVHAQVFALLTPEQQAKAKQLRAQREDHMKGGLGMGRGVGRGMGRGMGRGGRWI